MLPCMKAEQHLNDQVGVSGEVELLLPAEFALHFRLHAETVRRWIRTRRIHALKVGRSWRIPASEKIRVSKEGGL